MTNDDDGRSCSNVANELGRDMLGLRDDYVGRVEVLPYCDGGGGLAVMRNRVVRGKDEPHPCRVAAMSEEPHE